jgi:hypothetical protein
MPVQVASYTIKVRDPNLNLIGEVDAFDKLDLISRYNNVGSWQLTLADDHPMAPYLATPGYGVYVLRNGEYYFSGPVRLIDRQGIASNSLTVGGYDDMAWIAFRQAYSGGWDPYPEWVLAAGSVVRAYSFGDAQPTTTAVDFGPALSNATYHGGASPGAAQGLVDDPSTATSLGPGGYIQTNNTGGFPVGNQAFNMMVWFDYEFVPSATEVYGFIGTSGGANCAYMGILTTGKPTMQLKGVNTNASTALAFGVHCMILDYDGTTAKLYVDGAVVATATPGACTLAYGVATFGCYGAGVSNFAQSTIQYGVVYFGHLGTASLPGSQLNGLPWQQVLYDLGVSLYNINTYDTQSDHAETVIKHYVDFNLGPDAATVRQLANLSIETDAGQGSIVTYSARFEQLLQMDMGGLLQILASAGGVGMRVVQTSTPGLQFQVFVPSVANTAKFSLDLGNLGAYEYIQDAQSIINVVTVGGGGTGNARAFYTAQDATSVGLWGRCEGFVNAGTSTTAAQLVVQGTAALDSGASKLTFNGVFYETDGLQYVRDFNLGDKVSVVIDGATLTDIVREVDITLDPQNGETLKIGIGTPSSGQIVSVMQKYQQMNAALNTRVAALERV